jgi:hypothetical protein
MQQADPAMAVAASQLAADEELAAATASYHAVLLSPDLGLGVFPCLDRGSKVALRGVCGALRSQVNGAIEVVASPVAGFSQHALTASLLRWPALKHLTLVMVVGSSASDLAPLATTTLAGLKSLAVRQGCTAQSTVESTVTRYDTKHGNYLEEHGGRTRWGNTVLQLKHHKRA